MILIIIIKKIKMDNFQSRQREFFYIDFGLNFFFYNIYIYIEDVFNGCGFIDIFIEIYNRIYTESNRSRIKQNV